LKALRCTRIIAAHRLSTVLEADRILVLDQGEVVGNGRHAELYVRCPAYRELVRTQSAAMSGMPTELARENTQVKSVRPAPPISLPAGKVAHTNG
jgi:energy-coupling factor transporter ATP-binding protein EcfA2